MFIKISSLHQSNIEADTVFHVQPEEVAYLIEATPLDKKHRVEINTLVVLKNGGMTIATSLTSAEIIAALAIT